MKKKESKPSSSMHSACEGLVTCRAAVESLEDVHDLRRARFRGVPLSSEYGIRVGEEKRSWFGEGNRDLVW